MSLNIDNLNFLCVCIYMDIEDFCQYCIMLNNSNLSDITLIPMAMAESDTEQHGKPVSQTPVQ